MTGGQTDEPIGNYNGLSETRRKSIIVMIGHPSIDVQLLLFNRGLITGLSLATSYFIYTIWI